MITSSSCSICSITGRGTLFRRTNVLCYAFDGSVNTHYFDRFNALPLGYFTTLKRWSLVSREPWPLFLNPYHSNPLPIIFLQNTTTVKNKHNFSKYGSILWRFILWELLRILVDFSLNYAEKRGFTARFASNFGMFVVEACTFYWQSY